jgi:deoxyribonuclease (pyrimidine dimer)
MTRLNLTLKLSDELLINALGEEPRVLSGVLKRIESGKGFGDIPQCFTLNKGHVTFFYDKCAYVWKRYDSLRKEYVRRFKRHYSLDHLHLIIERYDKIENHSILLCNNWNPTEQDIILVKQRIYEKSKNYRRPHHYYGKVIEDWKQFLEL